MTKAEDMEDQDNIKKFPHHDQSKLCHTRPPYRQGKKLTAVKVASWICIHS